MMVDALMCQPLGPEWGRNVRRIHTGLYVMTWQDRLVPESLWIGTAFPMNLAGRYPTTPTSDHVRVADKKKLSLPR